MVFHIQLPYLNQVTRQQRPGLLHVPVRASDAIRSADATHNAFKAYASSFPRLPAAVKYRGGFV
jgi:hypothetical protein